MKLSHILRRQLRVARVAGIPVQIDYRWFVVFALSTWLIAENFRQGFWDVSPLDPSTAWIVGLITTLGLFLSIFGHELSHALIGRMEGIEIEEIVLHPFGGLARLKSEPDSPRAEFRIAVAGPAASFIFALVAFGGMTLAAGRYQIAWAIFLIIGAGNLMLAVFNLLPGYPLDGGRVLRALLWHRSGQLEQATRTVSQFGQLIAFVVVFFGLYMGYQYGAYFMAVWSVLVGLFLWDAARSVWRAQRGGLPAQLVSDAMTAPFAIEPNLLVSRLVDDILPMHRQEAFPVAHGGRLHGILTLVDLKKLARERWHRTRVAEVMRPVAPQLFVAPAMPLTRAEALMKQNGAGALAVVNGAGELVGFLQSGRLKSRPAGK